MENNNLNKQYTLLGYNIDIVKDIVQKISDSKLLSLLPITTLQINTLFHYYDKLTTNEFNDYKLGHTQKLNEDTTLLQYHYEPSYDQKYNTDVILINDKPLKVLDVSQLSIELGFNPLHFYFNNTLYTIDEQAIYDYCKRKKLDGYINLNQLSSYFDTNNKCPLFVNQGEVNTICSTIYLLYDKDSEDQYGINKLKTIGMISTIKKNKEHLTPDQIIKLYNLLFCNISQLIEITDDVKTTPTIDNHVISFQDHNKDYDFIKIYKNKDILDNLFLNYTNLNDECDFDCCGQHMMEIKSNIIPPMNVDIFVNYPINTNKSDKLFIEILSRIASDYDINEFLFNHYEDLTEIEDYKNLTNYINESKSIEQVKNVINELEKHIIKKLYDNYKSSDKGYKATLNLINLQYIPKTYKYLINKVMDVLKELDIEDVINILQNNVFHRLNMYFEDFLKTII